MNIDQLINIVQTIDHPICVVSQSTNTKLSVIESLKQLDGYECLEVCGKCDITLSKSDIGSIRDFVYSRPFGNYKKLLVSDFTNGVQDVTQDAYLKICEGVPSYVKIVIIVNDEYDLSEPLLSRVFTVRLKESIVLDPQFKRLFQFIVEQFDKLKFYPVPKIIVDIPVGQSNDKQQLIQCIYESGFYFIDHDEFKRALPLFSLASRLNSDLYTKTQLIWTDFITSL